MKNTPKQYAVALYEAVRRSEKIHVAESVDNFVRILAANNDLSQIGKIIEQFSFYWDRGENLLEAKVFSAQKLDRSELESIKKYLAGIISEKKIVLSNEVDQELMGGVIIKYQDRIIDASLKNLINSLKDQIKR